MGRGRFQFLRQKKGFLFFSFYFVLFFVLFFDYDQLLSSKSLHGWGVEHHKALRMRQP